MIHSACVVVLAQKWESFWYLLMTSSLRATNAHSSLILLSIAVLFLYVLQKLFHSFVQGVVCTMEQIQPVLLGARGAKGGLQQGRDGGERWGPAAAGAESAQTNQGGTSWSHQLPVQRSRPQVEQSCIPHLCKGLFLLNLPSWCFLLHVSVNSPTWWWKMEKRF